MKKINLNVKENNALDNLLAPIIAVSKIDEKLLEGKSEEEIELMFKIPNMKDHINSLSSDNMDSLMSLMAKLEK
jgi:hypothetical protein